MNKQPNHNPSKSNKVNLIEMSADVHKRDFKISRQMGDQNIQPAQVFKPEEAFEWALKHRELAERVIFCYEAGFSGFSLARRLQSQGIEPVVMSPQRLDERCKRVNTDKRDSRAIASRLDRFLAGNKSRSKIMSKTRGATPRRRRQGVRTRVNIGRNVHFKASGRRQKSQG